MWNKCLLLVLLLFSIPLISHGQTTIQMYHEGDQQVGVEYVKPVFSESEGAFTFLSSIWYISGRFPVGRSVAIVADIPIAHAELENQVFFFDTGSETSLGNPFIGIQIQQPDESSYGVLGLRLPLAPDVNPIASTFNLVGDFFRFEAFGVDLIPIYLKYGQRNVSEKGLYTNVLIGPSVWISTESGIEPEVLLDIEGLIGYDNAMIRVAGGLASRIIVTESGLNLKQRSISSILLQGNVALNTVRPGLLVRIPIDEDYRDGLDIVVGLTLVVDLNN